MATPRIIVMGGNPEQLHQITQLIPGHCPIRFFPATHQLKEGDLHPEPSLILLVQEGSDPEAMDTLQMIRNKLPGTPVLFIAEDPPREHIIEAFRIGIKDYLIFPFKPEDFLSILETHILKRHQPERTSILKQVTNWLGEALGVDPANEEGKIAPIVFKNFLGMTGHGVNSLLEKQDNEKASDYDLYVQFFGKFTIRIKGELLEMLPGEKINALLAYLLYYHTSSIHREKLLARFWSNTNPSSARNSLNVAMHNLRRHLRCEFPEEDFILYCNDTYLVNPELEVLTDTDQFAIFWQKGRSLEIQHGLEKAIPEYKKAVALYKGDFLEDIHYEEWCETERDNLKENYLIILDRLGTYFFQKETYGFAVRMFRKMLDKDPCLEDVHRKLILCYYKLGLRDKAIKQYYKCTAALRKELKIEPSHSTNELFELISRERNIPVVLL